MTLLNDTTFGVKCQYYVSEELAFSDNDEQQTIKLFSTRTTADTCCPHCCGNVIGHGQKVVKLKDVPLEPGHPITYEIYQHRYICKACRATFTEDNPFRVPGFNLTKRCILWIFQMLRMKISTSTIAEFLGIHWNTVRKVEKIKMDNALQKREQEMFASEYRPFFLAVDEFAIRKGHRYATCVMDLVKGDVLWVGKGRSMKDFSKFFEAFKNNDYLSCVKAVAMDMNASYHALVERNMPNAEIVYDRYHVQAQFGREVLGQVRLEEARQHQNLAKQLAQQQADCKDPKEIETLKLQAREEKHLYSQVKRARWLVLTNIDNMSVAKEKNLNDILSSHSDLAICYAMKEDMIRLFEIRDPEEARRGWEKWFDAAIHSPIPALAKFGRLKQNRIEGLVAHATFPINTGKLEGFNNKIKVAKRCAYGYRNLSYFFSYIKFLSIPKSPT